MRESSPMMRMGDAAATDAMGAVIVMMRVYSRKDNHRIDALFLGRCWFLHSQMVKLTNHAERNN